MRQNLRKRSKVIPSTQRYEMGEYRDLVRASPRLWCSRLANRSSCRADRGYAMANFEELAETRELEYSENFGSSGMTEIFTSQEYFFNI